MNILTYPLSYLKLEDESGNPLYRRNILGLVALTVIVSAPFIVTNANFFGDKGFLDRIGSFSAVLTGFYIAALVGIASFSTSIGDIDDEIKVGPILRRQPVGEPDHLTRRQYVCALFGYLSFLSLIISLGSILLIVLGSISLDVDALHEPGSKVAALINRFGWILRDIMIVVCSAIISHMFITTCHGLYYMIDRLYHKEAEIMKKPVQEHDENATEVTQKLD